MQLHKPPLPILQRGHPLARGLVSAWLFYEGRGQTVLDIVGGQHGTRNGTTAWGVGRTGRYLNFNATTDDGYLRMENGGIYSNIDEGGIFMLFNRRGVGGAGIGGDILISKNAVGHDAGSYMLWHGSTARIDLQTSNGSTTNNLAGATLVSADEWHTVVGMVTNAGRRLYIDGALDASDATVHPFLGNSEHFEIGHISRTGTGSAFDGDVAACYIYDYRLPAGHIRALHADPYAPFRPQPGILLAALVATSGPSTTTVQLSWTDNAADEDGYKIERSTDSSSFTQIGTAAADATSYDDDTAEAATTYYYRVRAQNANGDSDYSNVAQVTTA